MIDQELYDTLFQLSQSLDYPTYDSPPQKNTKFPVVVIGHTHLLPIPNKSQLIGRITATIHTWTLADNRSQASTIGNRLYQQAINLKQTKSYRLNSVLQGCQTRLLIDDSTDILLWHGIIELEYQFY